MDSGTGGSTVKENSGDIPKKRQRKKAVTKDPEATGITGSGTGSPFGVVPQPVIPGID